MSININGKEEKWFTSTINYYTKKRGAHQILSGKFGEFMKSLSNDELFFKTIVVDGKVYYSTEEHAKEAAAARWIDSIASLSKHDRNTYFHDETLVPLQYCVEMPLSLPQNTATSLQLPVSVRVAHAWLTWLDYTTHLIFSKIAMAIGSRRLVLTGHHLVHRQRQRPPSTSTAN
eukprot:scaffold25811_cov36-Cyclotella_meneghiniana.AAC.1